MKRILQVVIFTSILVSSGNAQIIMNGKSTYRPYFNSTKDAISISYGSLFWNDPKEKELQGYTEGLEAFHDDDLNRYLKNLNFNVSLRFGFEKGISEKISIKTVLLTGKLYTGASLRNDLLVNQKSKVFQFSTYGNYLLSRPEKKFKVHFMLGPEFMLVNKDVLILQYVEKEGDTPDDFNQKETIFEVGLTTGLGFSYTFGKHIALFTDGLIGVSLPGGGLKITNSGFGLKYIF